MKKVILLMLIFGTVLSGCKSTGGDPKTVLNHFFDALAKKDVNEAKKYVTADSEGMMGMVEMGMKNMADSNNNNSMFNTQNISLGEPVISGDRATVAVKDKTSGEETDFVLKKENGDWKVAFDKSTLMEMAQKKMKEHGMDGMKGMDSMHHENRNTDSSKNEENKNGNSGVDSAKNILQKMQKSRE